MNNLLLVVLVACGHPSPQQQQSSHGVESHGGSAPPATDAHRITDEEALMQEMQKLSDDMCNCKDAECAKKVADELKRWSEAAEKRTNPPRMSDDDVKRAGEIGERMGRCMAVLLPSSAGSAPTRTSTPGADEVQALQMMQKFSDDMCSCKDATCAKQIAADMQRWARDAPRPAMSDENVKRARDLGERMGRCMAALVPPAAGSATPPSAR